MKFEGIIPALITPIDKDGNLNVRELERMLNFLIDEGADGFYVLGATGEGLIVTKEIHKQMTRETLRIVNHRVPCIVHVARINYPEMLELAAYAEAEGAEAISAIPPIFYKYTEDEIYNYFKRLCDSVKLPVLIYNNPNTGVSFSNELLDRLFAIENLTGIKWTNPNYLSVISLRSKYPELNIINGPDELLNIGLTAGCDAGIGTTYTFMMPYFKKVYEYNKAGKVEEAQKYQTLIANIILALLPFGGINASKYLISLLGFDVYYGHFPSGELTDEEKKALVAAVRKAGLEI